MGSLHGHELEADFALEGTCAAPGPRGAVALEKRDGATPLDRPAELTALRVDPNGTPTFAIARAGDRQLVWDSLRGTFLADAASMTVTAAPLGHSAGWAHLLATVVVPLLLVERGGLALHASSALGPGGAVLFCGPSGRGKSTAAYLAWKAGALALADDAAMLDWDSQAPVTWPGGARLWVNERALSRDHDPGESGARTADRAERRALSVDGAGPGPFPIAAIVILDERGRQSLARPLTAVEALPLLVPCLVHSGGPEPLRASFRRLAAALERIPAWSVSLPEGAVAGQRAIAEVLELTGRV